MFWQKGNFTEKENYLFKIVQAITGDVTWIASSKMGIESKQSGISKTPRPHPPRCVGMLINGTDKGNLHLFDYLHFKCKLADSIHPPETSNLN